MAAAAGASGGSSPPAGSARSSTNLACIYLQAPEAHRFILAETIGPKLLAAGLDAHVFYGAKDPKGKRTVMMQITAPLKRLLLEAERLNWKVLLNSERLRKRDQQVNKGLVAKGFNFNPDGADSEHMKEDELGIPRYSACCIRGRDPYSFIHAPYDPDKADLYEQFEETGSCLTQSDALQLLKSCIEGPVDATPKCAGVDLDRLQAKKIIAAWACAHDMRARERLDKKWGNVWGSLKPPANALRNYLGERATLYYLFLATFQRALIFPALVGLGIFAHQARTGEPNVDYLPIYGIFVALWATIFLEGWKRHQNDSAMKWGSTDVGEQEPLRAEYIASKKVRRVRSYVDGKITYFSSPQAYRTRIGCSSTITTFAMGTVVVVVGSIIWLRVLLAAREKSSGGSIPDGWSVYLTSILNTVQIAVMSFVYKKMAIWLTAWECHPTETAHENSLTLKLAVFNTVNVLFNLVYVAGIKNHLVIDGKKQACAIGPSGEPDCMRELQAQLAVLVITRISVGTFTEFFLPSILAWLRKRAARCRRADAAAMAAREAYEASRGVAEKEVALPEHTLFDEYLKVLIYFGLCTLFVTAFPLAPLLILLGLLVEARLDSNKMLRSTRRPDPRAAGSIGAWMTCFEALSTFAVLSNLAVVAFTDTANVFGKDWSYAQRCVFYIAASHLVFATKWAVSTLIPDTMYSTTLQLERQKYLVGKHILGVKDMQVREVEAEAAAVAAEGAVDASAEPGGPASPRVLVPAGAAAPGALRIFESWFDLQHHLGITPVGDWRGASPPGDGSAGLIAAAVASYGSSTVAAAPGGSFGVTSPLATAGIDRATAVALASGGSAGGAPPGALVIALPPPEGKAASGV